MSDSISFDVFASYDPPPPVSRDSICVSTSSSDGWGLSVQAMSGSSMCWRKANIHDGAPGLTAKKITI